jgi:hypothetical protein
VNRIGGKSNSGEGGEDPIRWTTLEDADNGKERGLYKKEGVLCVLCLGVCFLVLGSKVQAVCLP